MTMLPEKRESKPAYMAQANVTTFSQQGGFGNAVPDAGWTALPGQSASAVRTLTSGATTMPKTVQPKTVKESIAEKNMHLMALVQQQERCDMPQVKIFDAFLLAFVVSDAVRTLKISMMSSVCWWSVCQAVGS